jgi:hypothetical protein
MEHQVEATSYTSQWDNALTSILALYLDRSYQGVMLYLTLYTPHPDSSPALPNVSRDLFQRIPSSGQTAKHSHVVTEHPGNACYVGYSGSS